MAKGGWKELELHSIDPSKRVGPELPLSGIVASPTDGEIVTWSHNQVQWWDSKRDEPVRAYPSKHPHDLHFTKDGTCLVGTSEVTAIVLDAAVGKPISSKTLPPLTSLMRSKESEWITTHLSGAIRINDRFVCAPYQGKAKPLALFQNGKRVAYADASGVSIWDYRQCAQVLRFDCPPGHLFRYRAKVQYSQ